MTVMLEVTDQASLLGYGSGEASMGGRVRDAMTREVVTVDEEASFKEIAATMAERRVSALPVLDQDGRVAGIVSEADLLLKEEFREGPAGGRLFQGRRQRVERAEAARLLHQHGIRRMPVVDPAGPLLGIVSRADLLKVFLRSDLPMYRAPRVRRHI